jgi:alkylation response protein AidB-like acyl-CoA dehydrogenase
MVITVVRTDAEPDAGSCTFSLLVLERDMPGFTRGRELAKLGLHGQDTSELHFEDVFVPDRNVLGEVGGGLGRLMQFLQLERLALASAAVGAAIAIFNSTIAYVDERTAFGKPIADFQNSRFVLADIATEIDVNRAFLDQAILAYNVGDLSAVDAAKLKLSPTERSNRAADRCLQLYGGYGYMVEDPAARVFAGLRVQRIYEVERGHARPHRSRHHRAPLSQVSTPALRGDLLRLWALAPNYFDVVV